MITVPVVNMDGQQVGTLEVDPAEFGGAVQPQLLQDVTLMYEANQRRGTHKTKKRGEVAGSGRKMYRQKGTGNARMGDRRTGKRRGGGTAFGPVPRDYSYTMPKKARRSATRQAILSKLQDAEAIVVEGLRLAEPKTKTMADVLRKLGVGEDQSCLVTTRGADRNVYLAARNIKGVEVLADNDLNAFAILRRKRMVLSKEALESLRAAGRGGGATTEA